MKITAEMLAGVLDGRVEGDPSVEVSTFAKIEEGVPGALSFLANPKYEQYLYTSASSVIIVAESLVLQQPVGATLVRVADPYAGFAKLLQIYESTIARPSGISDKAHIDPSATIGEDCYIGPFAVVEAGAVVGDGSLIYPNAYVGKGGKMGEGCTLHPNVVVYHDCRLGNGVVLHSGAVIGADGFGFAPQADGTFGKIPQIGNVVLEDFVEIGANTCVDRATMGSTVIGKGTKLDNQIQVGHNVVIGQNTVAAAQVGFAGSSKIGSNCMFGGQVGVAGHITIGDNVKLGAKSGVMSSVASNSTMAGVPLQTHMGNLRSQALIARLPEMEKRLRELEAKLK
jgi:UDP-3-O-[3-hydroxymyristoyl] glucosamine N-acyltransferase